MTRRRFIDRKDNRAGEGLSRIGPPHGAQNRIVAESSRAGPIVNTPVSADLVSTREALQARVRRVLGDNLPGYRLRRGKGPGRRRCHRSPWRTGPRRRKRRCGRRGSPCLGSRARARRPKPWQALGLGLPLPLQALRGAWSRPRGQGGRGRKANCAPGAGERLRSRDSDQLAPAESFFQDRRLSKSRLSREPLP